MLRTNQNEWKMQVKVVMVSLHSVLYRPLLSTQAVSLSKVLRGSEAYIPKQCGTCGVINDKLGGSRVFTCRSCGAIGDRDIHAAKNILLRFLV
jgi:hypothetical protein